MKKRKINRKEWRKKTSLLLAMILGLQVFTGNIAGVRALELPSGEERISDEGDYADTQEMDVSDDNAVEEDGNPALEMMDENADDSKTDAADAGANEDAGVNADTDGNDGESGAESGESAEHTSDEESKESSEAETEEPGSSTEETGEAGSSAAESGNGKENAAESGTAESSATESSTSESGTVSSGAAETTPAETTPAETLPAETTAAAPALFNARVSGDSINLAEADGDLYLYTAETYRIGTDITSWTGYGYSLTGISGTHSIVIGNGSYGGTEYVSDSDLTVDLNGLKLTNGKGITVNPIGTLNEQDTQSDEETSADDEEEALPAAEEDNGLSTLYLTVSRQSSIDKLTIKENAKVDIDLSDGAGLTVGTVSMEKGSKLTVHAGNGTSAVSETDAEDAEAGDDTEAETAEAADGGIFTVTGAFTGSGSVTFLAAADALAGKIILEKGISVNSLSLNAADLTAGTDSSRNKVTAEDFFEVNDSTIRNASLLGYANSVNGKRTLSFNGSNSLENVTQVGTTENGPAVITLEGLDTIQSYSDSTSKGISLYQDYSISYGMTAESGETDLVPETSWPISYRMKSVKMGAGSDQDSLIGYHTCSNDTYQFTAASSITLPEYTVDGYQYTGWKLALDAEEAVKSLTQNLVKAEDLILYLSTKSDPVTVVMDLGYTPDANTNDNYQELKKETTESEKKIGDTVALTDPTRFGYTFAGWKVTTGTSEKVIPAGTSTYTIELADTSKNGTNTNVLSGVLSLFSSGESSERTARLEAQWEAKTFQMSFFVDSSENTVPAENLRVMKNGNAVTLQEFADSNGMLTWDTNSGLLTTTFQYDESLDNFLARTGLSEMPQLFDSRTDGSKQDFGGWTTPGSSKITSTENMTFSVGSLLDTRSQMTLAEYESAITTTSIFFSAQWGTASYTLKTDVVSGWTILVDGVEQKQTTVAKLFSLVSGNSTMTLTVRAGSTVTYRCSASKPEKFSLWSFTGGFMPQEETYTAGDSYLSYSAAMPANDVTAVCSNSTTDLANLYVDLAKSPVIFEENVTLPSGRSANGFWYQEKMVAESYTDTDGKTRNVNAMTPAFRAESGTHKDQYFYIWDSADEFYVTTKNQWTTNQLVLVSSANLSMVDCLLQIRDGYSNYFKEMKIDPDGTGTKSAYGSYGKDFSQELLDCANIMTKGTGAPTINLSVTGKNNVIGMIGSDAVRPDIDNNRTLVVKGSSSSESTVYVGMILGSYLTTVQNLTVEEYNAYSGASDADTSSYLSYNLNLGQGHSVGYTFTCTNSVIHTPGKALLYVNGRMRMANSRADLLGVYGLENSGTYGPRLTGSSYLRVRKDVIVGRVTMTLEDSSSAVVDGSLLAHSPQGWASPKIDTSGYLVVKGSRCDLEQLTFTSGTLIANTVGLSGMGNFAANSVLYTNAISGTSWPVTKESCLRLADPAEGENADYELRYADGQQYATLSAYYPNTLFHYENTSGAGYLTLAGKAYLMGDLTIRETSVGSRKGKVYLTSENNRADDKDNPLSALISEMIDENGDLKSSITAGTLQEKAIQQIQNNASAAQKQAECVTWGHWADSYASGAKKISVTIPSTGTIFAAGNLNFLNEVTVSGSSTVWCGGTFSSLRGVKISGGTITADEIGIRGDYKSGDSGKQTYEPVEISGGTLMANAVGALTENLNGYTNQKNRAVLEKTGGTLTTRDSSKTSVTYRRDVYLNYQSADGVSYTKTPESLRFTKNGDSASYAMSAEVTLPELKNTSGAVLSSGYWGIDLLDGNVSKITKIKEDGTIEVYDGTQKIYDFDYVSLLPYQSSTHTITLKELDSSLGTLTLRETDQAGNDQKTETLSVVGDTVDVSEDHTVTITCSEDQSRPYLIVTRTDAAGNTYNMLQSGTRSGNSISFTMGMNDVEISLTKEHKLDLALHDYYLTNTGFAVDSTDAYDSMRFIQYPGSLVIYQSNVGTIGNQTSGEYVLPSTAKTPHTVEFASGFKNDARTITFQNLVQTYETVRKGVVLGAGSDLTLQIDGRVSINRFYVGDAASKLVIQGKHKNLDKDKGDILGFTIPSGASVNRGFGIGNDDDVAAGADITIKDLRLKHNSGRLVRSGKSTGTTLTIENCIWNFSDTTIQSINDYACLAANVENVTLKDFIWKYQQTVNGGFQYAKNVTLSGETEIVNGYGSVNVQTIGILYGITNQLTITDDAKVSSYYLKSAGYKEGMYTTLRPATITVTGNGVLNLQTGRERLRALKVEGNGKVLVSDGSVSMNESINGTADSTKYTGFLMAHDITVDGEQAEIDAGTVLISGYYQVEDNASKNTVLTENDFKNLSSDAFIDGNSSNSAGKTYTGLQLINGTISAETVGGDKNGKIAVSGGTLNAKTIGTTGYYYGYTQLIGTNPTVYKRSTFDFGTSAFKADVKISGGTVNVAENGTLGGMNANVVISGGKVSLGDGAVIGMSDDQRTTLTNYYSTRGEQIANHTATNGSVTISGGNVDMTDANGNGKILVPYGAAAISGTDTKVRVKELRSDYGSVSIKDANNGYPNPYQGTEPNKKNTIGVWVTDLLSAQTLTISQGAQVYAESAYAEVSEDGNGSLSVTNAGLYSASYGVKGSTDETHKNYNDQSGASDQTVFGTNRVTVTYVLDPEHVILEGDEVSNPAENPDGYTVNSTIGGKKEITLKDASCEGYRFLGWYTDTDYTNKVTELSTEQTGDLTLYASWEKIKVRFRVRMPSSVSATEFEGLTEWNQDGDHYESSRIVEIPYGDQILGVNGVNTANYTTKTLGVTSLEVAEQGNLAQMHISATMTVSREIAEEYKRIHADNSNAVIYLDVVNTQVRNATLTLKINRSDGKPSDARFPGNDAASMKGYAVSAVSVAKPLSESGSNVLDAEATGNSKGLIQPSATGYTFIGWNTDPKAVSDTDNGWISSDTTITTSTTAYAIWKANTYRISFNAGEGSWITSDSKEPAVNQAENKTMDYFWVYDTPVTTEGNFKLADGTAASAKDLPYAWKEGAVFQHDSDRTGWNYQSEGTTYYVGSVTELNQSLIKALDIEKGSAGGNPTESALTLTAEYRPVTITYHTEGGTFTAKADVAADGTDAQKYTAVNPEYGAPLEGYTETSGADLEKVERTSTAVTGENGSQYQVLSTKADYYRDNSAYDGNDYRNKIGRKGYTFGGWCEAGSGEIGTGTQVGTTPRFHDVEVYAKWTANQYKLTLYANAAGQNDTYAAVTANTPGSPISGVSVTVGQKINATEGTNWPKRSGDDAWYAQDKDGAENTVKRYLLGFTFAALDPGTSGTSNFTGHPVFENYAKSLLKLQNGDTVFRNQESVFRLPEDAEYRADIQDSYGSEAAANYQIPDYPNGSTISMYGVYRENSLIFVERYVDSNGEIRETVKHVASWDQRSNYPDSYKNAELQRNGYTLIGWYVNSTTTSGTRYPKNDSDYVKNLSTFQKEAARLGTYDIKVYTVYATQSTRQVTLSAQADPTQESTHSVLYRLPDSMLKGKVSATLKNTSGLKFVTKDEMTDHLYDQTWETSGTQFSSDNTVAIEVTVKNFTSGISSKTLEFSELSDNAEPFTLANGSALEIGAGDEVTVSLYHSKVMTKSESYPITLELSFDDSDGTKENTLVNQKFTENITVNLKPSEYKVTYQVQLPEERNSLSINAWGDFAEKDLQNDSKQLTKTVTLGYGAALTDALPEMEGYQAENGWTITGDSSATPVSYKELTVPVSAASRGAVSLTRSYTANTYTLTATPDVLSRWKIEFTDGADGTTGQELTAASGNAESPVKYHSNVTVSRKGSVSDHAEYVTLTWKDSANQAVTTMKLSDLMTANATSTSFRMPANAVEMTWSDTETLYLENGSITITADKYQQTLSDETTVSQSWPGSYVILQNAENSGKTVTENVLKLSGNLQNRQIRLGNLNISADDSIQLAEGTNTELTASVGTTASTITAKNILAAGENTTLAMRTGIMDGENENTAVKAVVVLTPSSERAAIGGSTGNPEVESIKLSNLELNLTMPAGSSASGIGTGSQSGTAAGTISLKDCKMTVEEQTDNRIYSGTWIGGAVATVTISDSEIDPRGNNHMAGPLVTNGTTVSITNSKIGKNTNVYDPIHAKDSLTISGSEIYQSIANDLSEKTVSVPVGTSGGTTEVSGSTINTMVTGSGKTSDLFSGKLKIDDADSDVYINGTQIIEIGNGNVTIDSDKIEQNGTSHSHSGNRMLIGENSGSGDAKNSVKIVSLGTNSAVTVRKPYGSGTSDNPVSIGAFTVENDAKLILKGNLEINGTASLAAGKTLTVDGMANGGKYGMILKGAGSGSSAAFVNGGGYVQNGGKIQSSTMDLGNSRGSDLDVTLTNVTAEVPNLYAKDLTVSGGSITAGNGSVGSMPVTGNSDIVTRVTFEDGAAVTAGTIGALGEANNTFTIVNAETSDSNKLSIHGTLVQDLYRLAYDPVVSDGKLVTSGLDHVVRASAVLNSDAVDVDAIKKVQTTILPVGGVPGKPENSDGQDAEDFSNWYIWNMDETSSSKVRVGLADAGSKIAGMEGIAQLTAETPNGVLAASNEDVSNNSDGTKTLTVHAWFNASGTASVAKGRIFQDSGFTDSASLPEVTICQNAAFTAKLTSTGTMIDGRDYEMSFSNALPAGTALTLTMPGDETSSAKSYYYYMVTAADSSKTSFRLSEFTKMGAEETPEFAKKDSEETFLVSVDFSEVENGATVISDGTTVSFGLLPGAGTNAIKLAEFKYTLTAVTKGRLNANGSTVQISQKPSGDEALTGKKLYLEAALTASGETASEAEIPYGAKAVLTSGSNQTTGTWINRNTVLFEAGTYGNSDSLDSAEWTVSFKGLKDGTYTITWTLIYADSKEAGDLSNVLGNSLSDTAAGSYTVQTPEVDGEKGPYLKVTTDEASRVLTKGSAHQVDFNWTSTAGKDQIEVSVEKQISLGTFNNSGLGNTITSTITGSGTASVVFGTDVPAGTYRVGFSMDENSKTDDVYFVFIVTEETK